ncbi:hypothetical protein R3W88_008959 [Solanum pinnatisectum]|uniref:Uncharacterized protein n=1 Tax=Solanum pinnatisectum TaxID=50273 RepID=A0AAV9MA40_9SOLN|nr:hypothetical protein R3W88_008959 [Solanum pinnatisectum]
MSLSGLTRMQVASHLQKCRRNNWRSPKERKYIRHLSIQRPIVISHETRSSFRKFGITGPGFPFPTHNTNNIFTQGESSIQRNSTAHNFRFNPITSALIIHLIIHFCLSKPMLVGATYSGSRIVSGTYIENAIINNVTMDNVTTYSSSAMMSDTYVGNVTINGLRGTNANASSQQYVGEPIMYGPRNIDVASYENYVEGSNSNDKENCDAYLNFNNMDNFFQNLGPSSANLPNEQGNEFDQVYFDDQILELLSANLPNELGCEFDQVYSDNQNLKPPSANLPNEQGSEFDQVYFDDQNLGPSSANLPNEQGSEFDQVYSDD